MVPKHSTRITVLNSPVDILHKVYHLLVWAPPPDLLQSVDLLHCLKLLYPRLGKGARCHPGLDPRKVKPYQGCLPGSEVNQGPILLGFNRMAMGEADEKAWGCRRYGLWSGATILMDWYSWEEILN